MPDPEELLTNNYYNLICALHTEEETKLKILNKIIYLIICANYYEASIVLENLMKMSQLRIETLKKVKEELEKHEED